MQRIEKVLSHEWVFNERSQRIVSCRTLTSIGVVVSHPGLASILGGMLGELGPRLPVQASHCAQSMT